jgi:hypothetical protein
MKLYEMFFSEVKRPTTSYVDRVAKVDRETGRLAVQVSKDKEDSLYSKMNFYRTKYKELKNKIMNKYSSRVKTQARK